MATIKLLVNVGGDKALASLADIQEKATALNRAISDFRMLMNLEATAIEEHPSKEGVFCARCKWNNQPMFCSY